MKKATINSLPDVKLLELLEESNRIAFNEIYNRYWKRLYGYVFKILRSPDLTEDVLQNVFLKIWENRESAKIIVLETYLFYACRNGAISSIRKAKFTDFQEDLITNSTLPSNVEQQLNLTDLQNEIESVMEYLPKRCKQIFRMSRFDQLSIAEISENLGISNRSVENQLSLALKHVRKSLNRHSLTIPLLAITSLLS